MRKFVLLLLLAAFLSVYGQKPGHQRFRVVSYNVENYFDCIDDSLTADEEFLPGAIRGWNYKRYADKQHAISRVLVAIGGWNPPELVGLCEVESRQALTDLVQYSSLRALNYQYIHYESPDPRGIDVALLYQPHRFRLLSHKAISAGMPGVEGYQTRDLLYVSGILPTSDTLHVFVCHFPSRSGGEHTTEARRMHAASILRLQVDSILTTNIEAKILMMGDFNDNPDNASLKDVLQAHNPVDDYRFDQLYNLAWPLFKQGVGTLKYQGVWSTFDQILVSGSLLLSDSNCFHCRPEHYRIFDAGFLLEDDLQYMGKKPFRTYHGMKYQGGFSDHLPVVLECWFPTAQGR